MTLFEDLQARSEVTNVLTSELERALGAETSLSVVAPGASLDDLGDLADSRALLLNATLGEGTALDVALVALPALATKLERTAADEVLVTAAGPVLVQTVNAIAGVADAQADTDLPREVNVETVEQSEGATIVFPILDGEDVVGALVVVLGAATDASAPSSSAPTTAHEHAVVAHHAGLVLADVEMGVTAELGRSTLTIRDLLSVAPGAVIDLDRAATAPVDILVNGTVIARGEVVIIDEEFGVRILEIIDRDAEHSSMAQP